MVRYLGDEMYTNKKKNLWLESRHAEMSSTGAPGAILAGMWQVRWQEPWTPRHSWLLFWSANMATPFLVWGSTAKFSEVVCFFFFNLMSYIRSVFFFFNLRKEAFLRGCMLSKWGSIKPSFQWSSFWEISVPVCFPWQEHGVASYFSALVPQMCTWPVLRHQVFSVHSSTRTWAPEIKPLDRLVAWVPEKVFVETHTHSESYRLYSSVAVAGCIF